MEGQWKSLLLLSQINLATIKKGFMSKNIQKPINFWKYLPQYEKDKVPVKETIKMYMLKWNLKHQAI